MRSSYQIYSPESLAGTIRDFGIIPFFRGKITGWSVEDITDPKCWFTTSDQLGPWDWKIDVIREGDIAYGKFIGGKAAFATVEFYRHFMNWRRSRQKYRICLRENFPTDTRSGKILKYLSPVVLDALRDRQSCEMSEIRDILSDAVTPDVIRASGKSYSANLSPVVKKSVADFIMQYLEMGTWAVIGDFRRVYKGPNLEYHGWQRSSHTMPDILFASQGNSDDSAPSWAKFLLEEDAADKTSLAVECSGEESLDILVRQVMDKTGCTDRDLIRKTLE